MNRSLPQETELPEVPSFTLGRNFLWMAWSGFISIANSLLVWIFMARMRDVDEVGRFTIVMGLYALFYSVVSLGLMPYLVNEISRRSSFQAGKNHSIAEFISGATVFLTITGTAAALLMTVCGFLISNSSPVRISTMVLSLAMIPTGIGVVAEAASISYGRLRLVAVVSTVENLLRTIVPLALIWFGFGIFEICISFAAVRFIAVSVYVAVYRSYWARFAFSVSEFLKIVSVCPTFAGTIVFASINWQAALILLGYFSTEAESAKYGAASRFLIPVSVLMASFVNVIQPMMARFLQKTPEKFGAYVARMARYPLIAASLVAISSPFLSRQVLSVLFGENYEAAAPTLDILGLCIVPFCVVMVVARGLIATDSQRVDLLANILGAVTCICSAVFLIPKFGAVGGATAQLLSFSVMAVVEIAYLSKKMQGFNFLRVASFSSGGLAIICLFLWNL